MKIDDPLNTLQVVLALVRPELLNSYYRREIEMKGALECYVVGEAGSYP